MAARNDGKISQGLKTGQYWGHNFLGDTVKFILFNPSASSVVIKSDSINFFFFF